MNLNSPATFTATPPLLATTTTHTLPVDAITTKSEVSSTGTSSIHNGSTVELHQSIETNDPSSSSPEEDISSSKIDIEENRNTNQILVPNEEKESNYFLKRDSITKQEKRMASPTPKPGKKGGGIKILEITESKSPYTPLKKRLTGVKAPVDISPALVDEPPPTVSSEKVETATEAKEEVKLEHATVEETVPTEEPQSDASNEQVKEEKEEATTEEPVKEEETAVAAAAAVAAAEETAQVEESIEKTEVKEAEKEEPAPVAETVQTEEASEKKKVESEPAPAVAEDSEEKEAEDAPDVVAETEKKLETEDESAAIAEASEEKEAENEPTAVVETAETQEAETETAAAPEAAEAADAPKEEVEENKPEEEISLADATAPVDPSPAGNEKTQKPPEDSEASLASLTDLVEPLGGTPSEAAEGTDAESKGSAETGSMLEDSLASLQDLTIPESSSTVEPTEKTEKKKKTRRSATGATKKRSSKSSSVRATSSPKRNSAPQAPTKPLMDLRHILKKNEKKKEVQPVQQVDFYGSMSAIPFLKKEKPKKKKKEGKKKTSFDEAAEKRKKDEKLIAEGEKNSNGFVIVKEHTDDELKLWKSMSALDTGDIAGERPPDMLPLRPAMIKPKKVEPVDMSKHADRAHNRPDEWLNPHLKTPEKISYKVKVDEKEKIAALDLESKSKQEEETQPLSPPKRASDKTDTILASMKSSPNKGDRLHDSMASMASRGSITSVSEEDTQKFKAMSNADHGDLSRPMDILPLQPGKRSPRRKSKQHGVVGQNRPEEWLSPSRKQKSPVTPNFKVKRELTPGEYADEEGNEQKGLQAVPTL